MGKTSAQRGETDTGLLPQQTHWGLCELGRQGRKWHWLPHTPSSVSASTGQAAQDTLAAGMEAALGLVSAGGQEAPSTEANRFWELQRCESNRADFCQDIFEELQTLASGRVLSPPPLNASAVPATYRTQCCPPPQAQSCYWPWFPTSPLSLPLWSLSPQQPDPPFPNSCLCRQNKMTNDPDTQHTGHSGAGEPGGMRPCPEMARGCQCVLTKDWAGLWPGRDTGTDSWSGGQVASGAAGL